MNRARRIECEVKMDSERFQADPRGASMMWIRGGGIERELQPSNGGETVFKQSRKIRLFGEADV